MDKGLTLAVASLVVGICAFIFSHFKTRAMAAIESDVAVLKKQMDLFWNMAEKGLGTLLHSPHREELDRLIEKVDGGGRLEPAELIEFDSLTMELIEDDPSLTSDEKTALIIYRAAVVSRHRAQMKPLGH